MNLGFSGGLRAARQGLAWLIAVLSCGIGPALAADPVPTDIELCPAEADVVDPEFDIAGSRIVYMDTAGLLKVLALSPEGLPLSAGCEGQLIDVDAIWTLPDITFRQGPEWSASQSGQDIYYSKRLPDGGFGLGRAWQEGGNWRTEVLVRGADRGLPIASRDASDPQARVMYLRRTSAGKYVPYWREANAPLAEAPMAVSGNLSSGGAPRWVPGLRAVTTGRADADGIVQAAIYFVDDRSTRQLTTGPGNKDEIWLWRAPEFGGDWAMISVVDSCCLRIYREIDGLFTEVNRYDVRALSGLSKIYSPEPFVSGGRSYVAFQASNIKLDLKSQIWMVSVDPAMPLARLISDPAVRAIRIEPEWVATSSGVYVYYTQYGSNKRSALRRAATGLN